MLALSACGYGFVSARGLHEAAAGREVVAGPVDNRSGDPDAGLEVGRLLSRDLARRTAGGRAQGRAVLHAFVESVTEEPVGVGGSQRVFMWRARARLRLELRDGGPGGRVLARSDVSAAEDYLPGRDLEGTEASRRLAIQRLLERLVADGLDRLRPVK